MTKRPGTPDANRGFAPDGEGTRISMQAIARHMRQLGPIERSCQQLDEAA